MIKTSFSQRVQRAIQAAPGAVLLPGPRPRQPPRPDQPPRRQPRQVPLRLFTSTQSDQADPGYIGI